MCWRPRAAARRACCICARGLGSGIRSTWTGGHVPQRTLRKAGDSGLPARRACCTCSAVLWGEDTGPGPTGVQAVVRSWRGSAGAESSLSPLSWTPSGRDQRAASHVQSGSKPPNDKSAKTLGAYLVQSQLQCAEVAVALTTGKTTEYFT
nr:uncharacterized protein LOC109769592 isoform X2 [Aegilops tauschii subsp. strangulata]XP_045084279.1 uncharacterized protein LOC109769592 isoform X2 [Aegilops tauschii subsp. strangulata]